MWNSFVLIMLFRSPKGTIFADIRKTGFENYYNYDKIECFYKCRRREPRRVH